MHNESDGAEKMCIVFPFLLLPSEKKQRKHNSSFSHLNLPSYIWSALILFFFNLPPTFLLLVGGTTASITLLYKPVFISFELSDEEIRS